MKFELNEYHRNVPDEELIADVKRVAEKLGKNTLTDEEYSHHGKYHARTFYKRFGSWRKTVALAGMEPIHNRIFSNEEAFEEIERLWTTFGRQPTATDIRNGISKYSLQSYARRFGGWRKALEAFVDFINSDDSPKEASNAVERDEKAVSNAAPGAFVHKTPRDINLKLRFKVFLRDHFKCCACGASPAKDPAVVLHVDHIVPWSKGGETLLDNLQTLCSKCNLGKSDM